MTLLMSVNVTYLKYRAVFMYNSHNWQFSSQGSDLRVGTIKRPLVAHTLAVL